MINLHNFLNMIVLVYEINWQLIGNWQHCHCHMKLFLFAELALELELELALEEERLNGARKINVRCRNLAI